MTALEVPLESMSIGQRLTLLDRVVETLPPNDPADEDDFEIPEEQLKILEERVKESESPDAVWFTHEEVKERLQRRFPQSAAPTEPEPPVDLPLEQMSLDDRHNLKILLQESIPSPSNPFPFENVALLRERLKSFS